MRGNNKTEVNLHFLSNSLYLEKNIILLKTKIKQQNKRESAKRHKHYFLVHWKLLCGLGICRNPFKRWVFIFLFVRFLFMFCSYTYLYSKRQQRLKLDVPAKKSKSYESFSSWPDKHYRYMYMYELKGPTQDLRRNILYSIFLYEIIYLCTFNFSPKFQC